MCRAGGEPRECPGLSKAPQGHLLAGGNHDSQGASGGTHLSLRARSMFQMQFEYLQCCGQRHLSVFFAGGGLLWCLIRLRLLPSSGPDLHLAVQQHHLKHHFPSEGRSEEYLLLITLCCSQSPSSLQPRSHGAPSPRCVCCTAAQGQGLGCGYRRVAHTHTHMASLPLTLLHPATNLPAPESSSAKWFLHPKQSAQQQKVSTAQGTSCSPACSWHLACSALETERKALERQASSCSQHHALVSATHCTNGQHTRVIYSPFLT